MVEEMLQTNTYQTFEDDKMEQCPQCERTFIYGKLAKHLKCCKGKKIYKQESTDAAPSPGIRTPKKSLKIDKL